MTNHLIQGTSEWLEMRRNYIMASDAPIIMGVSPYNRTAYQLWEEKLGIAPDVVENDSMSYGKRMEPEARKAYELYTLNVVEPTVVYHPTIAYMGASLDGLSQERDVAVEIKCVKKEYHEMARKGKIPEGFYPQLQHQLACLNITMLHYFSYNNGEGVLVEVQKDNAYIEDLYKQESAFWNKVQKLEEPDLTDKDYEEFNDGLRMRYSEEWKYTKTQSEIWKLKEEEAKALFIKSCNGKSARGNGVRLTKCIRKGLVDYKAIPQLKDVDLEKYRKGQVISYRITQGD